MIVAPLGEKRGNDGGHYKYRKLLVDYPGWYRHADADDAPDANETYRRVLAAPGHERRLRGARIFTKSPSSPSP